MSDVVVRVRGEHRVRVPAERGTVHLSVREQGPDAGRVRAGVEQVCAEVVATVTALHDEAAGPVRRYTVDQVRTSVQRPWNKGRQRPPVHHAAVDLTVEFDDFARLGRWLSDLADAETVQVDWVSWDLAEEQRRAVERDVRQESVRQARQRAQDYADALGLGEVRVRMIADTGLLAEPQPQPMAFAAEVSATARGGTTAQEEGLGELLQPDDIEVCAGVEAEFVVG